MPAGAPLKREESEGSNPLQEMPESIREAEQAIVAGKLFAIGNLQRDILDAKLEVEGWLREANSLSTEELECAVADWLASPAPDSDIPLHSCPDPLRRALGAALDRMHGLLDDLADGHSTPANLVQVVVTVTRVLHCIRSSARPDDPSNLVRLIDQLIRLLTDGSIRCITDGWRENAVE